MKKFTNAVVISTLLISTLASNAHAEADSQKSPWSGTFGLFTHYIFRGISATNNLPAVQGSLSYTFPITGIYFNIWGSNSSFLDGQGNTATLEMDPTVGITNTVGDNFTYNVYVDRYTYPKTTASYTEFVANLNYYFLTAQYGFSNNVYNTHKNGSYYNIGFTHAIAEKYIFNFNNVNISGGVGYYALPSSVGLHDYSDYNIQVSKSIGNYVLALQWTDTDGRSTDAQALKKSHLIASVTTSF